MEFAKPVIGTTVPAPATLAILSNTPMPVSTAVRAISVTGVAAFTPSSENPARVYSHVNTCPSVQMSPPIANAQNRSFAFFEGGDAFLVMESYSFPVVAIAFHSSYA